jgi:hypothetical protein
VIPHGQDARATQHAPPSGTAFQAVIPHGQDAHARRGDRLFHNRGDGNFDDLTEQAGITGIVRGYGHGAAIADYDNDGRPDIFLTRWHAYVLLHNRGDGTFEDATARAGLAGDRDWPTSAAFADFDNDGDLDLYVCHYLAWNRNDHPECADPKNPATHNCNPRDFPALPDHLFRNDAGRLVDVTDRSGLYQYHSCYGGAVIAYGNGSYADGYGLFVHLTQYFEQGNVFNAINFQFGPYVGQNNTMFATDMSVLWCPSDPSISSFTSNTGNAFDGSTIRRQYTDYGGCVRAIAYFPGPGDPYQTPGNGNFFPANTNGMMRGVFQALGTRNGGEVISADR